MPAAKTIEVIHADGAREQVAVGARVDEVIAGGAAPSGLPYVCAVVNNDVCSLSFPLEVSCTVKPLTIEDTLGERVYRQSVTFLLAKVMHELFPDAAFSTEHAIGSGLYCYFDSDDDRGITDEQLQRVDQRMRELVAQDIPIERSKVSFTDAVTRFEAEDQWDKFTLLRYRNPPTVVVYNCGGFTNLAHCVVAPRTGMLAHFKLVNYPPGFVIQFPDRDNPPHFSTFERQPHLFNIFREHKQWGRILGLTTVGQLNKLIADRDIGEFIKISEALHEKKIARIADRIHRRADHVRTVFIAGPSSAGKTTLSKRLRVQLRVNGLQPVTISVDDYFVNRENTPRHEDDSYDFEHVEAIDLDLLNQHLDALGRGQEIELPTFDFESGRREMRGNTLKLAADEILILEGIHCLNPRLSTGMPEDQKYKIYISCLGQLNLDRHNRISTTDNRLLRRMIRDHKYRGHSALTTLRMWPSVRKGEKTWIFPNQAHADIAFNSALEYEMAVLKPMAEPLLAEVKPSEPEYATARRLMEFLKYFLVTPEDQVPQNSILREYIGNSGFEYG